MRPAFPRALPGAIGLATALLCGVAGLESVAATDRGGDALPDAAVDTRDDREGQAPPAPPPVPAVPVESPEEFAWVTRTSRDRIGRVLAPVYVNGQGPFRFVIDTGASSSAISPGLAATLGIGADESAMVSLRGVTGTQRVPSILVEEIKAGEIRMRDRRLPVVEEGVFADADGILGVEGFEDACLIASFRDRQVTILRKGCPLSRRGWPKVDVEMGFGRLVMIAVRISGTRVRAIVDTGAERSLGNIALLQALELEQGTKDPTRATQVMGATSQVVDASLIPSPRIYLGDVNVTDLHVTFGDFDVFRLWGLESEPAILLGMDVLGTVDALMIDYRREELRFHLSGSDDPDRIETRRPPFGRLP